MTSQYVLFIGLGYPTHPSSDGEIQCPACMQWSSVAEHLDENIPAGTNQLFSGPACVDEGCGCSEYMFHCPHCDNSTGDSDMPGGLIAWRPQQ